MTLLSQPTWSNGGDYTPTINAFQGALLAKSSAQAITTGTTATTLTWNSATHDTDSFYAGANPSRLTVPADGYAMVYGGVRWATVSSATGRMARFKKNGATFAGGGGQALAAPGSTSGSRLVLVSALVAVSSGDYFEMEVAHERGSNLNVNADNATYFGIRYVPSALGALVKLTADQSITSAFAYIDWDAAEYDTLGAWDAGDSEKLTIPADLPHRLLFSAGARWDVVGSGSVDINIDRDDSSRRGSAASEAKENAGGYGTRQSICTTLFNSAYDGEGVPGVGGTDTAPNYYRLHAGSSTTQNLKSDNMTYLGVEAIAGARQTTIFQSADETIATATQTVVDFGNHVVYDDAGCFSSAATDRLTVPSWYSSGYAILVGQLSWDTNSTGDRWIELHKNGSTFAGGASSMVQASSLDRTRQHLWTIVPVSSGDYFQCAVWQNSGSDRTLVSGNTTTFSMILLPT